MTGLQLFSRVCAYAGFWGLSVFIIGAFCYDKNKGKDDAVASLGAGIILATIFLLIVLGITYW